MIVQHSHPIMSLACKLCSPELANSIPGYCDACLNAMESTEHTLNFGGNDNGYFKYTTRNGFHYLFDKSFGVINTIQLISTSATFVRVNKDSFQLDSRPIRYVKVETCPKTNMVARELQHVKNRRLILADRSLVSLIFDRYHSDSTNVDDVRTRLRKIKGIGHTTIAQVCNSIQRSAYTKTPLSSVPVQPPKFFPEFMVTRFRVSDYNKSRFAADSIDKLFEIDSDEFLKHEMYRTEHHLNRFLYTFPHYTDRFIGVEIDGASYFSTQKWIDIEAAVAIGLKHISHNQVEITDHTVHDDELTEEQHTAVSDILDSGLRVLQSPAGCGKSRVCVEVAKRFAQNGLNVHMVAFTGKAVGNLRDVFPDYDKWCNISTIHRMLGGINSEFVDSPRPDVIIVDEASMVDIELLLKIIGVKPKILTLVGDYNQLPPIGKGRPFYDVAMARPDLVSRLTHPFRNKEIYDMCQNMLRTQTLRIADLPKNVVFNMNRGKFKSILKKIESDKDVICLAFTNQLRCDVNKEIKGLREEVHYSSIDDARSSVQDTDKIVTLQNVYNESDLVVYNGEIMLYDRYRELESEFGRDFAKWDFGYCVTVHKAQGSQWDYVYYFFEPNYYLTLNTVYTAITRSKNKLRVLVRPNDINGVHKLKMSVCVSNLQHVLLSVQ